MHSSVHIIVDCGSGGTRIYAFGSKDDKVFRILRKDHPRESEARKICEVLARDERHLEEEWIEVLLEVSDQFPSAPVTIGCTGGVRDKLTGGQIREGRVEEFFGLITERLGDRVEYDILTGHEEAKYEFSAVRYCVKGAHPETDLDTLGLLSAGGVSSQLHLQGEAFSLDTRLSRAHQWVLKLGADKGLAQYEEYLRTHCPVQKQGVEGTFIGIELLNEAGSFCGLSGKLVPVQHAVEKLELHLEDFHGRMAELNEEEWSKLQWHDASKGTLTLLCLHLLKALHPKSQIKFTNRFSFEESHELKPSWPLGRYVDKYELHSS